MSYNDKRDEIIRLQERIASYGELTVEQKRKINYRFRLDWNYYSNSMEGNTLTMEETRSIMIGNLTVGGKPLRDVLEMKGHNDVVEEILNIGKGNIRLSEKRLKDIHKAIMYEDDPAKRDKIGTWKTEPNHVINYKGEKFEFTRPADVPESMHALLNKTNAALDVLFMGKQDAAHPLDVAIDFHLQYVLIHPFYDGNGRTARILTNLILIATGYPPFWIETQEKRIYYQYLADIQGYSGEALLFYDFVAGLIIRSQNIILDILG